MLKLIKESLLNPIQVSGEVNAALKENTLVVVTKKNTNREIGQFVYDIYACQGKVEDGVIVEHQK